MPTVELECCKCGVTSFYFDEENEEHICRYCKSKNLEEV